MHRENASKALSVVARVVTVVVVGEGVTLATPAEPPPPQPAASNENASAATADARTSGRRERIMFGFLRSTAHQAHHRDLNMPPPRLRAC